MSETGQIIYLDLLNFNDILDFSNGIGQLRIYFSYLVNLRRSRMCILLQDDQPTSRSSMDEQD